LEALGINLGFLLLQILSFIIVFIVLKKWVYSPIVNMLEKRRTAIAQGLEDARIASEARSNAEIEAADIIAEAQTKSNQIVREATERAEVAAKEVKTEAEAEIAKEREAAVAESEQERDRILGDLRGQVASLTIAAATKLIGESLDEQRQHEIINEFFTGIRSGDVVILEGAEISGVSAEVMSALPLTDEEVETIKSEILSRLGAQATVTFRVDPAIMGGIIIRVGGKVIDASITGQLESMRQSLS
jgi:F-type H+-transporting ATPase subunit b